MKTLWLCVLGILNAVGFLFPWAVACFLGGLLVGVWLGNADVVQQFKVRLEEARVRQDVLAGAVSLLAKDKFHAHSAAVESLRRIQLARDKAKETEVTARKPPSSKNGEGSLVEPAQIRREEVAQADALRK